MIIDGEELRMQCKECGKKYRLIIVYINLLNITLYCFAIFLLKALEYSEFIANFAP